MLILCSVDAIYEGRIMYTPSSYIDIIPDHYKHKPISLYNPREGPMLNQYRLMVPRTRNILDVLSFLILLSLYLLVMAERSPEHFGYLEACFAIYAFGWSLDQFATILEHGWCVSSYFILLKRHDSNDMAGTCTRRICGLF